MRRAALKNGNEIRNNLAYSLLFCIAGVLMNIIGAHAAVKIGLPLYLDNVGTLLSASMGGYVPGIIVGYLTNLINGIRNYDSIYYGVLTVLIAVSATTMHRWGWFKKPLTGALCVLVFAFIGGALGSVVTWLIYDMEFGQGIGGPMAQRLYETGAFSPFFAQLTGDFLLDVFDKAIVCCLASLISMFIPQKIRSRVRMRAWQQTPLQDEERINTRKMKTRRLSLRAKIMALVSVVIVMITVVTIRISYTMFRSSLVQSQAEMGRGVTRLIQGTFDADMVDEYIEKGMEAPGYAEAVERMKEIRGSSEDIVYVYVYQIHEDGFRVVFDPDDENGKAPGEIEQYEAEFNPLLPDLLSGKEVDPIETNGNYGWLLSVYTPVFDSENKCVCYAGADLSMNQMRIYEYSFLAKAASLSVAFFIVILTLGFWLADYGVILPVNSMAIAASGFAYDSNSQRDESVEKLKALKICTGDEIENLYTAITKMSADTLQYIDDVNRKGETIARMQDNLITVLADMVESRDKYTGHHVKSTAAYVSIIMNKLREKGVYADQLTDDFIRNTIHSAPLHDVGKIRITDALLNKPGKLTHEEFETMKTHTVEGKKILQKAALATDSGDTFLKEAENLALYHHEKWDGTGYPCQIAGDKIPLSARIMAVADVFDALVSKRSYKKGYSVEESMQIIRDGMGKHFDPNVAQAFLDAEDEVREVVREYRQRVVE